MITVKGDTREHMLARQLTTGKIKAPAPGEEEAGYLPLPLRDIAVEAPVDFNVFLKVKSKGQTTLQFMTCCRPGDEFQRDWFLKLNKLQIPYVYFSPEDMGKVMTYLQHHLELIMGDKDYTEVEKATMACDAAQIWNLNFFSNERARTVDQVKAALNFLDPLYEVLQKSRNNLMALLGIRRQGQRLYSHCLHVSLLGMAFSKHIGLKGYKARDFGLGSLIHDIGISTVPHPIYQKPGSLTEDEMYRIRRHALDGFRMVQNLQLPRESMQMIRQHHENSDGSGYPEGLRLTAIHPWARILRIVDSYAAMISERPWRPAMDPKQALWKMRDDWEKNKIYDANLLKSFFKFLAKG